MEASERKFVSRGLKVSLAYIQGTFCFWMLIGIIKIAWIEDVFRRIVK